MMSKRYYESISKIIRETRETIMKRTMTSEETIIMVQHKMIELMKEDNDKFNEERFRTACIPLTYK